MNLALEEYTDNPIIDELVCWPPKPHKMKSIRACCPIFRKPFIEIEMGDAEPVIRHFPRESFAQYWAEAMVILDTLSEIELLSDFRFESYQDWQALAEKVLATRQECIVQSNLMFDSGMFEAFLHQYGEDCKNLPDEVKQRIAVARKSLNSGKSESSVE